MRLCCYEFLQTLSSSHGFGDSFSGWFGFGITVGLFAVLSVFSGTFKSPAEVVHLLYLLLNYVYCICCCIVCIFGSQ